MDPSGKVLSTREREVACLYAEGHSHKITARRLGIAPSTVRTHLNSIYRKLSVSSRIDLFRHMSVELQCQRSPPARCMADCADLESRLELIRAIAEGKIECRSPLLDGRDIASRPAEAAVTRYAFVNGKRLAYRMVGNCNGRDPPLVCLNRMRGRMDDWDPAMIRLAASDRRVLLVDYPGVGESGGVFPLRLERVADDLAALFEILALDGVDLLGWSLGGMVSQILATDHPDRVRGIALVSAIAPAGGPAIEVPDGEWQALARRRKWTDDDRLFLFFSQSAAGKAAGKASIARTSPRRQRSRISTPLSTVSAQYSAGRAFFTENRGWFRKIRALRASTFVAAGDSDPAFPPMNSVVLAGTLPRSRLCIYPDAGHSPQFQYPSRFVSDLREFLAR